MMRIPLRRYASLINAPSIGCKDNYVWYSFQLNVARPQHASSGERYFIMKGASS